MLPMGFRSCLGDTVAMMKTGLSQFMPSKAGEDRMPSLLIADDHDMVRTLLADYFKEAGYAVRRAKDGAQAIEQLRQGAVDVMLVDLHMPGVNGLDTIRRARQAFPLAHTRVILMSGDYPDIGQQEIEDVGFLVGAHAVAYKPFSLPQLLQLVQEQQALTPFTCRQTYYLPSPVVQLS